MGQMERMGESRKQKAEMRPESFGGMSDRALLVHTPQGAIEGWFDGRSRAVVVCAAPRVVMTHLSKTLILS
jgi:hypothetical protein